MMNPHDIIIRPIISESSMDMLSSGKYTFEVKKNAGKIEIKKAVEAVFPGVEVESVNTMIMPSKPKRMGANQGVTSSWKKAIVRLAAGETIKVFEGV